MLLNPGVARQALGTEACSWRVPRRSSPGVGCSYVTADRLAQKQRIICRLSQETLCSRMLAQAAGYPEPQARETGVAVGRQPSRLPRTTWHPQSACGCHLLTFVRRPSWPPSTRRKSHYAFGHKALHNHCLAHGILTRDLSSTCPSGARKLRPSVGNGCHGSHLAPDSLFSSTPCPAQLVLSSCSLLSSSNTHTMGASPAQGKGQR